MANACRILAGYQPGRVQFDIAERDHAILIAEAGGLDVDEQQFLWFLGRQGDSAIIG
jgi:hypothetical protein